MRSRVAAAGALLLTIAVAIAAALPEHDRSALHTRGALHESVHVMAFGLIAWLSAWSTPSVAKRVGLCVAIILLGCATEYTESFLYHGTLEWTDMVLDAMGAVAGAGLGALTAPRERVPVRHRPR